MDLEQLFAKAGLATQTQGTIHLRNNLKDLLTYEHTESVFVELSEDTCISGQTAHKDLFEALADEHDLFAQKLPDPCGFVRSKRQTIFIWYLNYFTAGLWERIPVEVATTRRHVCVLEVVTWAEIKLLKRW